jgi:predicted RNA binding protein YcfA (HicA-like mRNA interferase family)
MPEENQRLLSELRTKKHSCTSRLAEEALKAWGFRQGRSKGHSQVWNYKHVTVTLHKPHGKHMKAGAVAMVIRKIEEAAVVQQEEKQQQGANPHVN